MRACYIQARGGSKRLPNKNILPWFGVPLVFDAIEKAKNTGIFDTIIVSSDSRKILDIARNADVIPMLRSDLAADDHATDDDVANEVMPVLKNYEYICKLYPCIPLITPSDIVNVFLHMIQKKLDGVYTTNHAGVDAGGVYWFRSHAYYKAGQRLSKIPWGIYELPESRCVDINTQDDLDEAIIKRILP